MAGKIFGVKWLDHLIRRTVVVHMTTGQSVRGILVGVYADSIVLNHCSLLGETMQKMDGEIVIPRETVGWLQTLSGE